MIVCLLLKGKIRAKGYRFCHPSLVKFAAQRPKFQEDGQVCLLLGCHLRVCLILRDNSLICQYGSKKLSGK